MPRRPHHPLPPRSPRPDPDLVADTCAPLVSASLARTCSLSALARGHYPGHRLPHHTLPAVRSVGHWDAPTHQPWHLDWHRNEGLEITFLERGQLPFSTDASRTTLSPGLLTVTRPWQRHRVGTPAGIPPSRLHWLILDLQTHRPHQSWKWPHWIVMPPPDLNHLTRLLRHCETPVLPPAPDAPRCFASIARAVSSRNFLRLTLHLNELLVLLLETLSQRPPRLRPHLTTARRSVQMFLSELPAKLNHPWTVDQMAHACALGRTRFVHHVQRLLNTTPATHLAQLRIDHARKLLQSSTLPITQIALSSGFSSSQNFATTFKKLRGHTPRHERLLATHSHRPSPLTPRPFGVTPETTVRLPPSPPDRARRNPAG